MSQHPYDMPRPCSNCPFRRQGGVRVANIDRAEEVCGQDGMFPCHKTVDYSDDGDGKTTPSSKACAGSLIYQMKTGQPNQMTRIAGRLGMFDPDKLDQCVFDEIIDDPSEMTER